MHPNFLDSIFDNGVVIWAARGLLISLAFVLFVGGLYVVASTVVRMKNREWLRRAGPFEVLALSTAEAEGQAAFWQQVVSEGQHEVEDLRRTLDETDEKFRRLAGFMRDTQ